MLVCRRVMLVHLHYDVRIPIESMIFLKWNVSKVLPAAVPWHQGAFIETVGNVNFHGLR